MVAAFERAADALARARASLKGAVFGQDQAVELALAVLVGGGHALIAGAPGVSKTRLGETLGQALGLTTGELNLGREIELSDLTVPEEARREGADGRLRPRAGPVFRQLLLVERLDAAKPDVRSALIEAMQEGTFDDGRAAHPMPRPFHVLAAGSEGLSEALDAAETDRFLAQVDLGWPDRDGERRMLIDTAGRDRAPAAMDAQALIEAQRLAVELPVGEKVVETILELVRRARPDDPSAPALVREAVLRGPGPRAGQALMRLARARALIDGRPSPSQADVRALALPVLKPRLMLAENARRGPAAAAVVDAITASL